MSARVRRVLLFVAALALVPAAAEGACDIRLHETGNVQFAGAKDYQVFSPDEVGQLVSFQVRHKKDEEPCPYFVTVSRGGAPTYDRILNDGSAPLHYQIYDSSAKTNVLKDLPEATAAEVLSGRFATTQAETQQLSYFVAIPPLQVVAPADYRDDIVLTLYEGTIANYAQRDSATVRVDSRIESQAEVCVGCNLAFDVTAQTHRLEFGVLEEGKSRIAVMRTRSNDGYAVSLSSQNRGVLRHVNFPEFIPYRLEVDGVAVDLSKAKADVAQARGITGVQGDPHNLRVIIGSVAEATAGEYADHITITVTAY